MTDDLFPKMSFGYLLIPFTGLLLVAAIIAFGATIIVLTSPKGRSAKELWLPPLLLIILVGINGAIFLNLFLTTNAAADKQAAWLQEQGVTEATPEDFRFPGFKPNSDESFGEVEAKLHGKPALLRLQWEGDRFILYEISAEKISKAS